MKKIFSKSIGLFLAFILLIGFVPMTATADTPLTPGAGGAMPTFTPFAENPDSSNSTFAGLYVIDTERWTATAGGYQAKVELRFPAPSVFGATSYDLYYSNDGSTGWAVMDGFNTSGDNYSFNPTGDYYYRLQANGGTIDGYTSNVVYPGLSSELSSGDNTYFSSTSLDESMSISGTMVPFVGRGLQASAVVKSLVDNSVISTGLSYEWYRVNPGTFEAIPISGEVTNTYITTDDDIGYKIMVKFAGDETDVNGYYQMLSSWEILFPNEAYASGVDDSGFTLNLKSPVPGLTASDLKLSYPDSDSGNDVNITITSINEIGDGAADNAVYKINTDLSGIGSSVQLTLMNESDFWTIVSDMGHGMMQGLTFAKTDVAALVAQAKAIIGASFTAVEGLDTNLITSLEGLNGMSDTGVAVTITDAAGHSGIGGSGDITYGASEVTVDVDLQLDLDSTQDSLTISVTVPPADTMAPVAGDSGVITTSDITSGSVRLTWDKATDTVTPQSGLKYYVVRSSGDNISTLSDIQTYGTLLTAGGLADASVYTATGLSPSATYYFNIYAADRAGNQTAYTTITATTAAVNTGGGGGGGGSTGGTPANEDTGESITISNADGTGAVTGTVTETDTGVAVNVNGGDFRAVANGESNVVINTGSVVVSFDAQAAAYVGSAAGAGDVSLTVEQVDAPALLGLPQSSLDQIGNRPVYDFSLTADGSVLSQFDGGQITIEIPYTPQPDEDPNALVVYYISDDGSLETVSGRFNAETGAVEFSVVHFSRYAVGYNKVTFSDAPSGAWYYDAVTFLAARGITTGTGSGRFAPDATLTRAQFIVMMMRAYGINPEESPADNFADAGSDYYTNYIAEAKRLGITNGVGGNLFAPDQTISREDMFTMLHRTLIALGKLPEQTPGNSLSDFSDYQSISDYAVTAMTDFVSAGIVSGSGGKLDPQGLSTRAQMAQVLYNLISI